MSSTDAVQSESVEALFEKAKAYLMHANKDGVSVYDQLARLMELILDENPDDVANDPSKFNDIFTLLQKHSFVRGESTAPCNEPSTVAPQELQRLADNKALFERPAPEVITTIEQPDPYTTITTTTVKPLTALKYESVSQRNRFWTAAGCGMPEEEAFLLDRSITKLTMRKDLQDVRFVGKIFGTHGNYFVLSSRRYVAEGEKVYQEVNTMPKAPRKKVDVPVQAEPAYVGCNRLSFWITSHPSAEWVVLPDVSPHQINAARNIKRLFSGNLDAEVVSSPPFPWNEAVYLRAQLSRIVSSTYIAPQGALEEPEEELEEEDEEMEDEDGAPPKPKEAKYHSITAVSKEFGEEEIDVTLFASVDQWVHGEAYIYKNGRQTKVPEKPETEEEEEEEEPQEEPEEEEEEVEEAEEEEEEERELFMPIRGDYLYAVIDIPQPPPAEDDEEEEEEEEEIEQEAVEEPQEDNNPVKPLNDEEVADDDVTKMKVTSWTVRQLNSISKAHSVVVVQSVRWPGATAYMAEGGKRWGNVYFGNGLKKTDFTFTPIPAPPVLSECKDITEIMDPTAAIEKLVRRGEEPPEPDSEDELEEAEEEEEM